MPELTLKVKMTCAVALMTVASLSTMAFFLLSNFEKNLRESIGRQQFLLVAALAETIDEKIDIAQKEMISFADSLEAHLLDKPGELQRLLDQHATSEPFFTSGLIVFSPTGTVLALTPAEAPMLGRDLSFRPYFQETVASGRPQISAPVISSQQHGHPIIVFTVPRFAADGRLLAVVGGIMDLLEPSIFGSLAQARLGDTGYLYLYASDRTILFHPDRSRILEKLPPGANRLFDAAIGGFEGTDETVTSRGQHVFSSFKRLRTRDWILAGNLPVAEAFAPMADARSAILLALALAIPLTLVATWLLMHSLTLPLLVFIDRVRQMKADASQRAPILLRTGDEIGVLAGAFNALLQEVHLRKKALQDSLLFHQTLVRTLPIAIYYTDNEGNYIGCNIAFASLFGHKEEDLIGRSAADDHGGFIPADDQPNIELYGDRPLRIDEMAVTCADGSLRDMMVFRAPFRRSNGEEAGSIGILIDITERKRMEQELQRSRDFYLTILEDFPALIWRSGIDGQCDYLNRTWLDFTGRRRQEELGDGWAAGVHPDDRQRCLDTYLEAFHARCSYAMEYRLRRHDGEYRWMLDIGRPYRNLDGHFAGFIGSVFDVTDRRQAVDRLQLFSRTTEQSSTAVIITDTRGRIEYVNPAFTRLTGYRPEEVAGQSPRMLQSGATSAAEYRQIRQMLADGRVWQGDFFNRKKNGEFYWATASISPIVNERGELTHFVCVQEDVTEKKTAQESAYRLRILRDGVTEALQAFLQTSRTEEVARILVQCSIELLHAAFGFFIETATPPRLLALLGTGLEPDRQRRLEAQLLAFACQRAASEGPACRILARGDFAGVPVDNMLLVRLELSGRSLAIFGLCNKPGGFTELDRRDMEAFAPTAALTLQSIRAEQARQQATEDLRVAQKFEAIGQLAGGVAHDFNNLLSVINGYSAMLIRGLAADEENRRDAETILAAGQKAADLTRQLLAFSRRQVLQPIVLDLNELIDGFRKILLRLLREDIEVDWSLAADLGPVKADPGQIEQILINLVVNARDAMPQGGQLFIATANAVLDEHFTRDNPAVAPGRYAMLSVRDTGVGMEAAVRERIFDPFFTTKEPGQGTGLGLSTVYGIVRQSGGHIAVFSVPGAGSEFRVFLPITDAPQPRPAEQAERLPAPAKTILLVEDEPAVAEVTARMLENQGYIVLSTCTPAEALHLARGNRVDLLLTDMIMPGMNGPELAAALRREIPGIKVLFMSGYGAFHASPSVAGAESFLQKPFSPDELGGKVTELLGGRR